MCFNRHILILPFALAIIAVVCSCSTVSSLAEGEYRLAKNSITITNSKDYPASDLTPYIKQEANKYYLLGWNPFLYVYNWSDGSGSKWDKFTKKLGTAPVVFDSTQVDATNRGMLNHLEYQGYYNSRIHNVIEKDGKLATVHYNVEIGKQFPIKEIIYSVNDTAISWLMAQDFKNQLIHKGDALSQESLENESERIAKLLRNNGYYGFTKNYFFYAADTVSVPDSAILYVRLANYTRNESPAMARPHKKFNIGTVAIVPSENLKVRPSFLHNLNRIEPSSPYNEQIINNTYQRFTSNSLFSSVNLQLSQVDSSTVDCHILLTPSKLQGFKLKLEGSVNSTGLFGISPSLSYYHKNIFHGGETFNLGFMGNFQFMTKSPINSQEFAITSSISFPTFLLLPDKIFKNTLPRTDVSLNYNYQNRPEYTRNIISASYGYTWNIRQKLYFQIYPFQTNIVRIFDMSDEFYEKLKNPYLQNAYQNHFDIGGSAIFYYTTSPETNPRKSYFYLRCQTDFSGNFFNVINDYLKQNEQGQYLIWNIPYSQYARCEISVVPTIRFGDSDQFAFAFRFLAGLGKPYGNSVSLPFEKLFYAGGANSLRGWQARSVGPGNSPLDTTFAINNQTGDMHLEVNAELRFPLFWKLNGALFIDAGNIWNIPKKLNPEKTENNSHPSEFSFKNIFKSTALAYGTGVRLDLGMILIRLDLGVKGYDPAKHAWLAPSEWFDGNGYSVHFAIGYPF